MKSVKALKEFSLNGIYYEEGNEVKISTKEQLVTLIEKGFIEPLTPKQIQDFEKEKEE